MGRTIIRSFGELLREEIVFTDYFLDKWDERDSTAFTSLSPAIDRPRHFKSPKFPQTSWVTHCQNYPPIIQTLPSNRASYQNCQPIDFIPCRILSWYMDRIRVSLICWRQNSSREKAVRPEFEESFFPRCLRGCQKQRSWQRQRGREIRVRRQRTTNFGPHICSRQKHERERREWLGQEEGARGQRQVRPSVSESCPLWYDWGKHGVDVVVAAVAARGFKREVGE